MQEPSPGRTALPSCLPALNSSSKPLPSLLVYPPSCSPKWAHTLLSHCKYAASFSSPHLSAFGAYLTWRREHDVPWSWQPDTKAEYSISEKRGHSPRTHLPPQTALPCSCIIPASIHTFKLVLSLSFPTNTQLCCIFSRTLVEPVGFGIAATTSPVFLKTGFSEHTTLLGLAICVCLCGHPLSPQANLSQICERTRHSKVTPSLAMTEVRDPAMEKAAKQAQP